MTVLRTAVTLTILLLLTQSALGVTGQFRARKYERDFRTKITRGKGEAWLKDNDRQIWADEIEWNLETNEAVATGHVKIIDGEFTIYASRTTYRLDSGAATLEDATLISGPLILKSKAIRKLSDTQFEADEGSYTYCNNKLSVDAQAAQCSYDWRLFGRKFEITVESFARIYDAVFFAAELPIWYSPFLAIPIKTNRQTGFLMPSLAFSGNLGSSLTLPFFWAMSSWQDMTLTPTYWSGMGMQWGLQYRYKYSHVTQGQVDFSFAQRRFSLDENNPGPNDRSRKRFLGFLGEGSINATNLITFGNRSHSRQVIHWVTHPYYLNDYPSTQGIEQNLNWLRSQISITSPSDDFFMAARATYLQSLNHPKDNQPTQIDYGGVAQLPTLLASRPTTRIWDRYLAYEVDAQFSNFYRDEPTDFLSQYVPANQRFAGLDYLRVGQRFNLEPRLIATLPMPTGVQLQPMLTAGTLIYHFDQPNSQVVSRQYIQQEIPLSFYIHKNFTTGISGFEQISHVFQPRLVYASSLYNSGDPAHPFFARDQPVTFDRGTNPFLPTDPVHPVRVTSPRFDYLDQAAPYHYGRLELINRFRRNTDTGIHRFLLLQLSQQYNASRTTLDPRYSLLWAPLELFLQTDIWRLSAQLEANYHWEKVDGAHPSTISSSVTYTSPDHDRFSVSSRFHITPDPAFREQTIWFDAYKTLPVFFDVRGGLEYSMRFGQLVRYEVGVILAKKPKSCWSVEFTSGKTAARVPFARLNFQLEFGGPSNRRFF